MGNASGIAAILGRAAQIAPIDIGTKLFAGDEAAGGLLNGRTASGGNLPMFVLPLRNNNRAYAEQARQQNG